MRAGAGAIAKAAACFFHSAASTTDSRAAVRTPHNPLTVQTLPLSNTGISLHKCFWRQGGVSITSMAERTLGKAGARFASATYLFLHYALLVACAPPLISRPYLICALRTAACLCAKPRFQPTKLLRSSCADIATAGSHSNSSSRADIAKAGSILGDASGLAHAPAAIAFAAAFTALCYFATPRVLDRVNSALVVAVVASFLVRCLGMRSNPQYCAARGHYNVSYSDCVCGLLFNTACMSYSVLCCWAHGTDTRRT